MAKMKIAIRKTAPKKKSLARKRTTKANPNMNVKFAIFQLIGGDREFVGAFIHKAYAQAIANLLNNRKIRGAQFVVSTL